MSVNVSMDLASWPDREKRMGSLVALGVVVLAVVGGLVTYFVAPGSIGLVSWILVAIVALALVFLVLLLVLKARAAPAAETQAEAHEMHAGHAHAEPAQHAASDSAYAPPAPAPAPPQVQTLTLRCGDCSTVFDVSDTGERPLYHTCPGCGAEGALRDVGIVAPIAAPTPPASAAPATHKRLRLRCGGCKEVFAIDDSGERPLRRPCPHCGRTGEIR